MVKYTENEFFKYSEPRVYGDKDIKKWYVEYYISYPEDDGEFKRVKLYGEDRNRIQSFSKKDFAYKVFRKSTENLLIGGIDPQNNNTAVQSQENEVKKLGRFSFTSLYRFYSDQKGYTNPKPKQQRSALNVNSFFKNHFKPFLIEQKLDENLNLVTKKHVLDFLNARYMDENGKRLWSNNTYNNFKTWIGSFFNCLINEDKLTITNPCATIKNKPKEGGGRYDVFSKEELSILFNFLEEEDFNHKVACQMIYYAYIRGSELSRLRVSSIDLQKRIITIKPDDAKGQKDGLERDVLIAKDLHNTLSRYLSIHKHEPDDFLFGKNLMPGKRTLSLCWHEAFRVHIKNLRKKHVGLFTKTGLTMYALKHSGVTHFFNDNLDKKTANRLTSFIQSQCRHESFQTTQLYLKKLPITLKEHDEFAYEGF